MLPHVYKSHSKGPDYVQEVLVPYVPPRNLQFATENKLSVPNCHYADTKKRAFGIRWDHQIGINSQRRSNHARVLTVLSEP